MRDGELGGELLRQDPLAAGAVVLGEAALARHGRDVRVWALATLGFWGVMAASLLGLMWWVFGVVGPYSDRALPDLETNIVSLREHDFSRMTPAERVAFRTAMAGRVTSTVVGLLAGVVFLIVVLGVANTWLLHSRLKVAFAEIHPALRQISEELRRLRTASRSTQEG